MSFNEAISGSFERSISLFRASYSFIAQPRAFKPKELALVWFGPYAPSFTVYMPIYVAATVLPDALTTGSLFEYDPDSAYWSFLAVGNWVSRFYRYAMPYVEGVRAGMETGLFHAADGIELQASITLTFGQMEAVVASLTQFVSTTPMVVTSRWSELLGEVITRFHDGYIMEDLDSAEITATKLFYPRWWLKSVGYFENNPNPDGIMFEPSPIAEDEGDMGASAGAATAEDSIVRKGWSVSSAATVCGVLGALAGSLVGYAGARYAYFRRSYTVIPL